MPTADQPAPPPASAAEAAAPAGGAGDSSTAPAVASPARKPLLIGAGVLGAAALTVGAIWLFGGKEAVISGVNTVTGGLVGSEQATGPLQPIPEAQYLSDLRADSAPVPILDPLTDPPLGLHSDRRAPYLIREGNTNVVEIAGTRLRDITVPDDAPARNAGDIHNGLAVVYDSPVTLYDGSYTTGKTPYLWDIANNTFEAFPMPAGTEDLLIIHEDLFIASTRDPDTAVVTSYSGVNREGEVLWTNPAAEADWCPECTFPVSRTSDGPYATFAYTTSTDLVDPRSGATIGTRFVDLLGFYPEGLIKIGASADKVEVLAPTLDSTLRTFTIPPESLHYFQSVHFNDVMDFDTAMAVLEKIDAGEVDIPSGIDEYDLQFTATSSGEVIAFSTSDEGLNFGGRLLNCQFLTLVVADGDRIICTNDDVMAALDVSADEAGAERSGYEQAADEFWGAPIVWEMRVGRYPESFSRFDSNHWLLEIGPRVYLMR